MHKRLIVHNDVTHCTESVGDSGNPAILLMAGATVSMLYWDDDFCRQLADRGFCVIRYDNRDTGQSTTYEPGTTPYDLVNLADDAGAILDAYDVKKASLVGMSLGGLLAQIVALKYADRVQTLTLLSTGPWGDSDSTISEMDPRIVQFQAKKEQVDWTDEDAVVRYLQGGDELMSGRKAYDAERGEKRFRAEFRRANNYVSMYNHAGLQGGEAYYNRLDEIRQPTLIIHGTDDRIWPYQHAGVLLEKLPDARLLTLDGTGHELHRNDWNAIIGGIAQHSGKAN